MTTELCIKILVLEDVPADTELMLRELRRHGIAPICLPAGTEAEYLAALDQAPDIILADYYLPRFTALHALELLQVRGMNVPFIVVSGSIGEEKAVEMMRLGAADYLLKDRLARLGPAVLQAIEQSRLRREKRLADEALRVSEERFKLALDNVPHPFVLYDDSLRILFVNASGARFFGRQESQILGRRDQDLFPAEVTECFLPELQKARDLRQRQSVECVLPLPTGEHIFQIHYVPLLTNDESIREILGIAVDITEWMRMERLKDDMLSAVSHEMRTPLTAIIGFSEFLLETPVDRTKRAEYLKIIHRESERLKELVENILDLQRLKARFNNNDFDLLIIKRLLQKALNRCYAERGDYVFVLDCPMNLPLLEGNEAHLFRALENLLANAVKYSEQGSTITLGARIEEGQALLWVKDQGVGIPEQALDQVFDRFFRVDTGNQRKSGGTGLGLALVKEIAEEHKGRAWVESALGKGSTFYLSLPLKQDESPA
ncbi:ATP-binding protein [Trichloromonas sp.]|uniref:sensor histidine kinase n=1 Tax=Trichloromonas sp. TaxID=3069249 RepID=UPI003D81A17D